MPDAMLESMLTPISYTYNGNGHEVSVWDDDFSNDFQKWRENLTHGNAEAVEQALENVEDKLHLTVDGFVRMMALCDKGSVLPDEEKVELASILTGAKKRRRRSSCVTRSRNGG